MNKFDWLQILATLGGVLILSPVLGKYMALVFEGKISKTSLQKIDQRTLKFLGIDSAPMNSKKYLLNLLCFNFIGFIFVFSILVLQGMLPLNPQALPGLSIDLAFNTAVSFVTNTNWQSYGGESTLSYFSQMVGLAVQNFLSAATGIAVLLALIRGISRRSTADLGNFWLDLHRSILFVLLPISFLFALFLMSQGVIQNFLPYIKALTLEGKEQIIPMGPAASQIAIKMLGTNGGGFLNVNGAHPFENPTPLSNFFQMISIILIPSALVFTFGEMTKKKRDAWILFGCMSALFIGALGVSLYSEYASAHVLGTLPMEGKETRFGVTNSILWSVLTTAASNGSVNAMHSSLSPLSGGVAMLNMMLGEIVFGGVGSGLYGMLIFVLLTVFLAGLMVGRTPEYMGKKLEAFEMKWIIIAILAPSAVILFGAGFSCLLPKALASLSHSGPHGLSELLYAFTSAGANNGSAFGGLSANTPLMNYSLGAAMLIGRFMVIAPVVIVSGSLAEKKISPPSSGTFPTDQPLFGILLISVILIVGALTFFPALSLGPILEHLIFLKGGVL